MSALRDPSATERTMKGIAVRDAVGLKTIQTGFGRDAASVLKTVFSGMKVHVVPLEASGYAATGGDRVVYTNTCAATVTGGTAPYTYAWTASAGWSALAPALANTSFSSPAISPGDTATGDAYVTVTDANGQVAVSNSIILYGTNGGWPS